MRKVKTITASIAMLFLMGGVAAQVPVIQWQKCLGGYDNDRAYEVQQTMDGGYIVAGETNSSDGDVTGLHGATDDWIVKLDSMSNIEWQRSLGSVGGNEMAYSIKQTSDGGYIVAGTASSLPDDGDITTGTVPDGYGVFSYDFWVVKLSSTGNIQWQKCIGGTSDEVAYSVSQTVDGGYIVAGYTVVGTNVGYVVKLSSDGDIQWQRVDNNYSIFYSVQQTLDGGYIVEGYVWGNIENHEVNGGLYGSKDVYVIKLNNSGDTIQWQKSLGGTDEDGNDSRGAQIQQTSDGGYVLTTSTQSDDGDVWGVHGTYDMWVVKLNNIGTIQWQRSIGGTSYDWGRSIQQTADGEYIVAGGTNSVDGDVINAHNDFLVVKLNSAGDTIRWSKYLGGSSSYEDATSIRQTTDGGFIIVGETYGIASSGGNVVGYHNPNTSYPPPDIWIVKLKMCTPTAFTKNDTACGVYTFGSNSLTSSGTYYDTLTNAEGCDSIITLHLTISQPTTSTQIVSACDSYIFGGIALTQSGTYYDTLQNAVSCDSIVTLNLTISQPTTSTQIVSACDSYIFGGIALTQSGTYYDTLQNAVGCDSIVTLNLTISQPMTSVQMVSACSSYRFGVTTLTVSGTYYDTLQTTAGCDSTITLNLTINANDTTYLYDSVSNTYDFNGVILTASGTYYDTLQTAEYCDSLIVLNLTILSNDTIPIDTTSTAIRNISKNNISIFPNPSNGKFAITSDISQSGTIEVYSITGAKVFAENVSSLTKNEINLSAQAKGIYLVKVSNAENIGMQKIVIE